jgi:hypothetical protein
MRRAVLVLAVLLFALPAGASRRRATHGNPHAEVTATAEVESPPRRKRHSNGREFEEFRARLVSVAPTDAARAGFPLEAGGSVRIFHDLTCGGTWIDLAAGDRVELRGEYVRPPDGRGIIHFTHPAGGKCGRAGAHVDGYLRRQRAAAAAAAPSAPRAASADARLESFRASVRPILSVKCAPCHEPGGKMYARLPFDDADTVASHAARMATRLKGDDRKALESWASTAAPPQQR